MSTQHEMEDFLLDCKELFLEIQSLTSKLDRPGVTKQTLDQTHSKTQELVANLARVPDFSPLLPILLQFENALSRIKEQKMRMNRPNVDSLIGAFDLCCNWFASIHQGQTIESGMIDASQKYVTVLRLLK